MYVQHNTLHGLITLIVARSLVVSSLNKKFTLCVKHCRKKLPLKIAKSLNIPAYDIRRRPKWLFFASTLSQSGGLSLFRTSKKRKDLITGVHWLFININSEQVSLRKKSPKITLEKLVQKIIISCLYQYMNIISYTLHVHLIYDFREINNLSN